MHILISNDDGFDAPGLTILMAHLKACGWQVTVVSTRDNKSGSGQALSLRRGIHVEQFDTDFYVVDGTPADGVYIALQSLVKKPVDIVVSGINNGANLGDDILYSGTFAAAMEARRLGLPSIAVSVIEHDVQHYQTAAKVSSNLVHNIRSLVVDDALAVLNVNLPDVPYESLRGFKATSLGKRLAAERPELDVVDGQHYYWLGRAGEFENEEPGSDNHAVANSYVSVTPVSSQLEHRPFMSDVQRWLGNL